MKIPFVTYKQAAEILGITEPSLRQRVERGKMPAPVTVGPRFYLFPRSQIELLATGNGHTLFPETSPSPTRPLEKRLDAVVDGRGRMPEMVKGPQYFHVRIYTPEDRSYEVVVIGKMTGTIMAPSNRIETVAREVLPLVHAPLESTLWVTVDPRDSLSAHHITTEALTYGAATDYQAQWDQGSVIEGLPAFKETDSRVIDFDELSSILGQPPEWYPAHAYTREVVEYWQRNARPKQVTVDPKHMISLVAAIRVFADLPVGDSHVDTSRLALRLLSHELRRREQSPTFSEPATIPPAATVVTSVDRPYAVDHASLPRVTDDDVESTELPDLVRELRSWRREVDKYSEEPSSSLTSAVDTVLNLAIFALRREAMEAGSTVPADLLHDEPERVRNTEIAGGWDRRWIQTLRRVDDHDSAYRRQRKILGDEGPAVEAYFIEDHSGAFVGVADTALPVGSQFSYLATTKPFSFRSDDRLVADGAPGHRPLYLLRSTGEVRLFPEVRSEPYRDMWNFGYSGGGPGATAYDVARVLEANGVEGIDEVAERHIDSVLCDPQYHDVLDVALTELVPGLSEA